MTYETFYNAKEAIKDLRRCAATFERNCDGCQYRTEDDEEANCVEWLLLDSAIIIEKLLEETNAKMSEFS